jgi:hypothetical protein
VYLSETKIHVWYAKQDEEVKIINKAYIVTLHNGIDTIEKNKIHKIKIKIIRLFTVYLKTLSAAITT